MPDFASLWSLLVLAILTEASVQFFILDTYKPLNKVLRLEEEIPSQPAIRWLSALIGIAYAFNMSIDIFVILGFPSKVPLIGTVSTGLVASRGSNYIHDLMESISNRYKETII